MAPSLSRFEGCLLGLMAGDCLGLPREGLSAARAERLFGREPGHRLLFGRSLASDDTEHACLTAQAFLAEPRDPDRFADALGWKLRLWLLGLPAGIGLATLRAALRLWAGVPAARSGVASAGNGPAMRSPVLGLACWTDDARLRTHVRASTRLTHTDPRAERGALAAALAARYAALHGPRDFSIDGLLEELSTAIPEEDAEGRRWLDGLRSGSLRFDRGVSGYIYHTVPAALAAWLASPFDFESGMRRVLGWGGDTDTAGAVYGAVAGAAVGVEGIPRAWLDGIAEQPRSVDWVRRLAGRLHAAAGGAEAAPLELAWHWLPLRNAAFAAVVLAHGFRRLLPPY